jgi:hypothetical protein
VQIAGYDLARPHADDPSEHPTLHVADDTNVEHVTLAPGTELTYTLGNRHCAGHTRDDHHEPCTNPNSPYCPQHTTTWACARCTGNCNLPLDTCTDEHAIYLAAFAPDTFKVGVTRSWRLRTRLHEQGADRAAHINTVPDGRIARQLEAELARDLTDRVRTPTKRRSLATTVDHDAWTHLLDQHDPLDTYTFDHGLDLHTEPIPETIATGTIRGTKGRLLVLEHTDTTYAVDLRDLVGHDVTPERATRDVQASLGNF